MNTPLVSVIIPAYNAGGFISETLDSVFAQAYRPMEVIVVDDGSTDETAKTIDKYREARGLTGVQDNGKPDSSCLIYVYQANSGPSSARNAGIIKAKGEYIAFLDADDLWVNNKISKQMQLFERDPSIDIIFSDAKILRRKKDGIEEVCTFTNKRLDANFFGHEYIVKKPLEKLFELNFISTSSVISRKLCFDNGFLFNVGRRHVEDWELWVKMSLKYKFGYINIVGIHKRETGGGLSSDTFSMYMSQIDILESIIKNKSEINLHLGKKFLTDRLRNRYKWTGYLLMKNNYSKLARDLYKKALKESFELKILFYYIRSFF